MSFQVIFYFAASAIILTHSKIASVNGQCTTEGCTHDDLSMNIVTEIQQQIVQAFGQQNKQTQSNHDLLTASLQQLTSQHDAILRSLQAVDRRLEEHDTYIKQGQRFHELLNASFQEMQNQHETVNKSFQAVDRRLLEQSQGIYTLLNESFQEIKSQQGTVMTTLRAADRDSQEHNICTKQIQSTHDFLNESLQEIRSLQGVDRYAQEHNICTTQVSGIHALLSETLKEMKGQHDTVMTKLQAVEMLSQDHDTCIRQNQNIREFLNESIQQTKSQHETVIMSLQELDRHSQEHNIYIKQVPGIRELLNESFQQTKSQFDSVNSSLRFVDQRLQSYQIDVKNQTQQAWRLVSDIWNAVVPPVSDCSDMKAHGHTANGVYEVCVGHQPNRVCANAYCDMKTTNGTSLVFQRRKDGSVNFNRTWAEYRNGFGNPDGEFWLGNEMLHLLTSKRKYKLRVDLEDWEGEKAYAEYSNFSISSSADNYRLTVGNYSGNAGNGMNYNNGEQFSTIDADNDDWAGRSCAMALSGGGWWYASCTNAYLNGKYYQRHDTVQFEKGIIWYPWKSRYTSLKATEMKLVPVA